MLSHSFGQYWYLALPVVALALDIACALLPAFRRNAWNGNRCTTGARSLLIINGQPLDAADDSFIEGVETVFRSIDDLAFVISVDRRVRVYETVEGRDLANFGLVQVAGYPRPTATLINAVTAYLRSYRVPIINANGVAAPTKLFHYLLLAQAGLPVPATVYLSPGLLERSYDSVVSEVGSPFVLKALSASGGRHNYLIIDQDAFSRQLLRFRHTNVRFLAQTFVANDSTYRLLVFGDEVRLAIRCTSRNGSHLTNTEQGGHATLIGPELLDPDVRRLAVRAAALIGCDVAGVNLMQDLITGEWFILDTNSAPPTGTGPFIEDRAVAYATYLRKRLRAR